MAARDEAGKWLDTLFADLRAAAAGSAEALKKVRDEEARLQKERLDAAKQLRAAPEAEARARVVAGAAAAGPARERAAFAATPRGQAYAQAEAATRGVASLAKKQQEVAELEAQRAYQSTAAGRAQLREEWRLAEQKKRVGDEVERQRQSARPKLDRLGGAFAAAVPIVGEMAAAAAAAVGTLTTFAAKASPTHLATLEGSIDLLMARLGRYALPLVESGAKLAQTAAAVEPPSVVKSWMAGNVAKIKSATDWIDSLMGGAEKQPMVSLAAMPQARVGTAEQYYDRLMVAGLNQDALQAKLMEEQLKNLVEMNARLEQMGQHTEGFLRRAPQEAPDAPVPFR